MIYMIYIIYIIYDICTYSAISPMLLPNPAAMTNNIGGVTRQHIEVCGLHLHALICKVNADDKKDISIAVARARLYDICI